MPANLSTLFSYPSKAWRGKRPDSQGHDWLRGGVPYPDGAFHVLTDQGVLHDEGEAQGLDTQVRAWRLAGGNRSGAYGDAGTDEKLWPDDDNSHCRATVFMEAPGLSAYGVTMWVYIIPVGRIPDMPAWFVSMMPGAKGTLASIELDSETEWLNSNQRNEGPERDEKLARIMAKGYDSWKDRPAVLGDDVMLVAACLCPHPDLPMDSSNSAEDTLAFAACGATLGKLPQKPAAAVSTLSPKLSRPKHHGLEVMALHMPTGIYLPTLLTA